MTMEPFGRAEDARWVFRELRELRDSLREMPLNSVELGELSMGMSNDFRVAVEEGATIVRVGGAIFGK
jgi:PLP dependent protein